MCSKFNQRYGVKRIGGDVGGKILPKKIRQICIAWYIHMKGLKKIGALRGSMLVTYSMNEEKLPSIDAKSHCLLRLMFFRDFCRKKYQWDDDPARIQEAILFF